MSDYQQKQPSVLWEKQFFGVARTQFFSAVLASVFLWFWQGEVIAISVLSGGILVGLNSVLLARSVMDSSQVKRVDGRGMLYRSAAVRFVLLIAALVCANWVGLHLLAVAAGMFMAYAGGYVYIVRVASRAAGKASD